MKCRHCNNALKNLFIDLGSAPPSNSNLKKNYKIVKENYNPLRVFVCKNCWLVQTQDFVNPDQIFNKNYNYFSGVSNFFLSHAKSFVKKIISELQLNNKSFVIEIASNDGYLLQNFIKKKISCLGIEPTESTAKIAKRKKIPVLVEFFSKKLAKKLSKKRKKADLIIGNNVYAHVPNINDFTDGLKLLLKKGGTITLEFPHLLKLIKENQFDTIYHEHYSYLSLISVIRIFKKSKLRVWKVVKINTHGGSLRIYGCHESDSKKIDKSVSLLLKEEIKFGLKNLKTYKNFMLKVNEIKNNFLLFLIQNKLRGKMVVGYGAAAKGNTLINFAGVKSDLISYICDKSAFKQRTLAPGSHIPIFSPNKIKKDKPDYIIIFPWNIKSEIKKKLKKIISKKTKFVTFVPKTIIS